MGFTESIFSSGYQKIREQISLNEIMEIIKIDLVVEDICCVMLKTGLCGNFCKLYEWYSEAVFGLIQITN